MIKNSSSFKLNEIHRVDSPFNENPKNIIFSREALISGEGRLENLGKWAITETSIAMQIGGVVNFEIAYQPLPPGTKILVTPQFSYMPDQFLGKMKKSQNLILFKGLSLPKYKDIFKRFLYGQTSLVID